MAPWGKYTANVLKCWSVEVLKWAACRVYCEITGRTGQKMTSPLSPHSLSSLLPIWQVTQLQHPNTPTLQHRRNDEPPKSALPIKSTAYLAGNATSTLQHFNTIKDPRPALRGNTKKGIPQKQDTLLKFRLTVS